jgi:hypothetical protein
VTPGAARVARHRQRAREGLQVIRLVIPTPLLEALISDGLLTEDEALDPDAVSRAIGRIIREATTLKIK